MSKKFVLSFVLILLMSSVAVSADYYYERTSSTGSDGSSFDKEIEWRGRASSGPTYTDDYDRYYDGPYRKCSSRSSNYYNKYYGQGYNTGCNRRYSYRASNRYTTTYERYNPTIITPRYSTTSSYNYRGRTVSRTFRY